jgi:hypothetical protein
MRLPRSVSMIVEGLGMPSISPSTTLGRELPIQIESPTWRVDSRTATKGFSIPDADIICEFVISCYRSGAVTTGVSITCQESGVLAEVETLDSQIGAREMEICRVLDEIYEDTKRQLHVTDFNERLLEVTFGRAGSHRR